MFFLSFTKTRDFNLFEETLEDGFFFPVEVRNAVTESDQCVLR